MKEFVLEAGGGKNYKINYQQELNRQQLDIVENAHGSALVLAGAGSGKTRTITYRVAFLLENGVTPENILLLTFTNKAAKEMVQRVEDLLGEYPKGLWAGTFHSIANRLLRRYGKKLGFESNFSILDQADSKDLIRLCMKDAGIDKNKSRFPSAKVLQALISFARNKNVSLERALEIKNPRQLQNLADIETIAAKYAAAKHRQNAMDFDDLLLHLLSLLEQDQGLRESLSHQFEYVLVDEFQDTNVVQAEIVRLLASKHGNLLVVGDDAQSIYSFRAADIGNILNFPKKHSSAQVYKLTKNYRSTPQILHIANAVISSNTNQFQKVLEPCSSEGEKPCLVPARHTGEEANYIVQQIKALEGKGTPLHEIAVLFRAAFHSQALEFELMKRNIPYDYRGGMRFFERSHIKDVVAHLRVIQNVKDTMAWVRTLTMHPGIGLVTAQKIANQAGQYGSVREAIKQDLKLGKKAQIGWNIARRMWQDILSGPDLPQSYVQQLSSNKDYIAYLENEFTNYKDRLEDLEQFVVFASDYDDLRVFLDDVSLTEEYGAIRQQSEGYEDRVVLSTIHQAKGLEWDTVFIIKMNEGSFPHSKVVNEEGGLEEERRLFYVAVTRARKKLFLTYPLIAGFQHEDLQEPSSFLEEVPDHLLDVVKLRRAMQSRRSFSHNFDEDEPTIVLDSMGEEIKKPAPSSFLKNLDEL